MIEMAKPQPIEYHVEKIKELHAMKIQYPDSETIDKLLYSQLSQWEYKLQKIAYRPNNEKTPWKEEELRLGKRGRNGEPDEILNWIVQDMPLMTDTGLRQAGDYCTYYKGGGVEGYVGVLIERKGGKEGKSGAHDLYHSIGVDNRQNLYEEGERAYIDPRFTLIVVLAECSLKDLDEFTPLFIGNQRNRNHVSLSVETRDATIAGLYIRGMPVLFAGSRTKAVTMYRNLVRQWLMKNYEKVLGLEENPHRTPDALRARLAVLKAESRAIKEELANRKNAVEMLA
jgi:hypothetical protein